MRKPIALAVQKLGELRWSTWAGLDVRKSLKSLQANSLRMHLNRPCFKKLGDQLGQSSRRTSI